MSTAQTTPDTTTHKRRKRWIRGGVIALGLTLIAGTAVAWGGHHHRRMTPEKARKFATWMVDDTLDDLEANDRQRKQVHAIKDDLLREGFALKKANQGVRKQALAWWNQPKPKAKDLHKLVDERAAAFTAFAHKVADGVIDLHGLLTPDQRDTLAERVEKRRRR